MSEEPSKHPEEDWARHIVSTALGVPVCPFDDDSADSMPDALIHMPHAIMPMEVVQDWDSDYSLMKDALHRLGNRVAIDPAAVAWRVTLRHTARVKDARARIAALIDEHAGELNLGYTPTSCGISASSTRGVTRTAAPASSRSPLTDTTRGTTREGSTTG